MANASDLLILAGLIGGGLYLYSTGFFNNMIQDPRLPTNVEIFPSEAKKEDDDDDEKKKVEVIEALPPLPDEFSQQQQPPPFQQQQQHQAYYPPQLNPRTAVGPPPGLTSSLYPMNVPMGPPYISGTVNTYSPYSPYNQFKVYEQYQTPGWGMFSTLPDDNITFTDIDITNPLCYDCKANCMRNPYGSRCRKCRPSCKRSSHSYRPPQTGWTISPVNRPTAQVFLGMLADTVFGTKGTFAEMDDYSEKRRFDCHNHLKRRVKAKDNSFLSREDYFDHADRFQFNIE
jgi:hypothetical protein